MKKIILSGVLLIIMALSVTSQVRDISITAAPTVEYTWWDNATILNNGNLIGGRVGFGFGQFFELRGVYMKSFDLKSSLNDLNWKPTDALAKDLKESNVDITRWGGEMKANIGFGSWLAPYLTLGTGVQTFEFNQKNQQKDMYKEEQIYVSGGLGAKINLSSRMVLALEGKSTIFNMNPGNPFLNEAPKTTEIADKRLYNWSALASLEFYIGGKNPKELTELDRAYKDQFTGGLKAFKFVIEPGIQFVDFNEDSYFRDAYFGGVSAGFDLSKFIGIRGFYYQATNIYKFKDLSLDKFNPDLAMYGGNIIARLNYATGVVPYITLGGGYLHVKDDYIDNRASHLAESTGFATGGIGIEIPLSKYLVAYGSSSYMLSTTKGVSGDKITHPSDLNKSIVYRAGLRIQIGSSAKPDRILDRRISSIRAENKREISSIRAENDKIIEEIRREYKQEIAALNQELNKAYEENDVEKVVAILKEKEQTEQALQEIEEYDINAPLKQQNTKVIDERALRYDKVNKPKGGHYMIKMTPEEFEQLIEKVLKKIDEQEKTKQSNQERIDELEKALIDISANNTGNANAANVQFANSKILEVLKALNQKIEKNTELITHGVAPSKNQQPTAVIVKSNKSAQSTTESKQASADSKILEELKALNKKIEQNTNSINRIALSNNQQPTAIIIDPNAEEPIKEVVANTQTSTTEELAIAKEGKNTNQKFNYKGASVFTGPNFGDAFNWNVGVRSYFDFGVKNLQLMPEAYIGLGKKFGFGVSGNVIYTFKYSSSQILNPYVGLGVGVFKHDNLKLGANIIVGTWLKVLNGKVFVDYSNRNLFRNNQIAVGYRVSF